jgi:hypothetical protein
VFTSNDHDDHIKCENDKRHVIVDSTNNVYKREFHFNLAQLKLINFHFLRQQQNFVSKQKREPMNENNEEKISLLFFTRFQFHYQNIKYRKINSLIINFL